jgi:L-cysteine S-thiosulfotransferase
MSQQALVFAALAVSVAAAPAIGAQLAAFDVVDGGIPRALTGVPGDPARGRMIVGNRQGGMCLLCHQAPIAEDRFQGDISTNLAGVGARWTVAQLRLRIVNPRRINPDSVMPAYYRVDGLERVAFSARDKPILDAQQIEDVVAWLASLK